MSSVTGKRYSVPRLAVNVEKRGIKNSSQRGEEMIKIFLTRTQKKHGEQTHPNSKSRPRERGISAKKTENRFAARHESLKSVGVVKLFLRLLSF